jgi:DNA-binding HxlR family transcriptional regulator
MLMFTLRNFEPDGLIRRTVTPSIPPPVDYKLTEIEAAHAMYDGEKDGAS